MIVRCPECSTGFKLPDSKVSTKPVKLRCSKCSHIFHFRLGDGEEAEVFYTDDDRQRNQEHQAAKSAEDSGSDEALAAPDAKAEDDEEANPNRTQFGMPAADISRPTGAGRAGKLSKKLSKSASSDYNPFPHANLDIKSNQKTSMGVQTRPEDDDAPDPGVSWEDEATRVMDVDSDPDDDPFSGAFDPEAEVEASKEASKDASSEQEDPFAGAFGEVADAEAMAQVSPYAEAAAQSNATEAETNSAAKASHTAAKPGPANAGPPTQNAPPQASKPPAAQQASEPGAESAAAAEAAAAGAQAGASPFQPDGQAYRPEDMVDPSFGKDGPTFDPERGVVDNSASAASAASSTRMVSGPAATRNASAAPPVGAASAASAAPKPKAAPAPDPDPKPKTKSRPAATWEPDDFDAPHKIGGGGAQKAANFLLILLLVVLGFIGLLAAFSDGIIDFKRFPHTLEVAFQGADFQPRSEWVATRTPEVVATPEDPIRIESVFATPVQRAEASPVILVRGSAKNTSDGGFDNVELRAIIYDENERTIGETTGYLGARIQQSAVAKADPSQPASALLPDASKPLTGHATQPFTLIFDKIPAEVIERANISYRVEIASKTPQP